MELAAIGTAFTSSAMANPKQQPIHAGPDSDGSLALGRLNSRGIFSERELGWPWPSIIKALLAVSTALFPSLMLMGMAIHPLLLQCKELRPFFGLKS